MLNFAEQTGSGAVIVVWSFLNVMGKNKYINYMLFNTSINPAQAKTRNLPQVNHAHPMATQLSTRF